MNPSSRRGRLDRHEILRSLFARLDKAVWEYKMFQQGDRTLVAVSGGADSMSLLSLLAQRRQVYAADMQLTAVYIDLGFADGAEERCRRIKQYAQSCTVPIHLVATQIGPYAHSRHNTENPCFLCSRIRRKHLFETAERLGCNKIVLGHHKDDLVETLLINMFFGREISTSPPMLRIKNGRFHLLRPLVFVEEALIKQYAAEFAIPCFSQQCPTDGRSHRQIIKHWLNQLEAEHPGLRDNIFFSMTKVKTDYLLQPPKSPCTE